MPFFECDKGNIEKKFWGQVLKHHFPSKLFIVFLTIV